MRVICLCYVCQYVKLIGLLKFDVLISNTRLIFYHSSITKQYRGGGRGGKGGGMKGGSKVVIEPHRHEGVFIARGKEDALVTLNSTPGVAVYGEKRISVESPPGPDGNAVKVEYRVWNPFRSSEFLFSLSFLLCVDLRYIRLLMIQSFCGHYLLMFNELITNKKVAAGTSVSHVSDIVGPKGNVYAVEFSHRPGRDLLNVAKARTNVIQSLKMHVIH